MICKLEDMSKERNARANFVWTRSNDANWTESNQGRLEIVIDSFCHDEYYCTPVNLAGAGPNGTITIFGEPYSVK